MSFLGFKDDQIALDAALNVGKLKHSFTTTQIAAFANEYLRGGTIPEGTIVYDATLSKFQYYDGSWIDLFANADFDTEIAAALLANTGNILLKVYADATAANAGLNTAGLVAYLTDRKVPVVADGSNYRKSDDYVRLVAFWSQDTDLAISQVDASVITLISPCAGRVRSCKAVGLSCTDDAALMFNNADFAGGAEDLLSANLTMTNATEGAVRSGSLSATLANLVVAANDRILVQYTSDGSGHLNDLTVMVEIEPSTGIVVTDA